MSQEPVYDGEMTLEELEDAARLVSQYGPDEVMTAAYQVAYHLPKVIVRLRQLYGENEGLKVAWQNTQQAIADHFDVIDTNKIKKVLEERKCPTMEDFTGCVNRT